MAFYDLNKEERAALARQIVLDMLADIRSGNVQSILQYFSDEDTYIRKNAYLAIGRICHVHKDLRKPLLVVLHKLSAHEDCRIRQTVMNAAGEIAKSDFEIVSSFFDVALFDKHHSVRNAVIGSVKKAGEVNPRPVLEWAGKYLHHADKEIRREICHGIELRGRKHPQDILPLLKELQFDKTARVRNTLVQFSGKSLIKKDV